MLKILYNSSIEIKINFNNFNVCAVASSIVDSEFENFGLDERNERLFQFHKPGNIV